MKKAVALRYNDELPAPFISTKGRGYTADSLLDIAEKHSIPIVKDEILSDTLFMMDPGEFIPEEVFDVVAEILVFIKKAQELI